MTDPSAPSTGYTTFAWKFRCPHAVPKQPFLAAGDRLVSVDLNVIYALDIYAPATFDFELASTSTISGLPTSSDGCIYFMEQVSSGELQISARQIFNGKSAPGWKAPRVLPRLLKGGYNFSSLAGFPGIVLAQLATPFTGPTLVMAYNTSDGSIAWGPHAATESTIDANGISVSNDAFFFIAENAGGSYQPFAVNSDFGDVRFPKKNGPVIPALNIDPAQAPLIGIKAVICSGDNIYGFDRKSGAFLGVPGLWGWSAVPATPSGTTWSSAISEDQTWVAAVSDSGQIVVFDPDTGALLGAPAKIQSGTPTISGDYIYVTLPNSSTMTIVTFNSAARSIEAAVPVDLENIIGTSVAVVPTVVDATIFAMDADSNLYALPQQQVFAAAYFHPDSCISVKTVSGWDFGFGANDFSIEAWVHGSGGGEVISSHLPAGSTSDDHSFRFNVGPAGELRFATINSDLSNQDLARTAATIAADGTWHHVAMARDDGEISFFLDGLSIPVLTLQARGGATVYQNGQGINQTSDPTKGVCAGTPIMNTLTPPSPPAPCSIAPAAGLTIGAYSSDGKTTSSHFVGQIRELRVWNLALDAAAVNSRMDKELGPLVPQLIGNWYLDDEDGVRNAVQGLTHPGEFHDASFPTTDLVLEDPFPYALHQPALPWPYASSWIVRGAASITTSAAVSDDHAVCFGVSGASLYGVNESNGTRLWEVPINNQACSNPFAFGDAFYVAVAGAGLLQIDARTGVSTELAGFGAVGSGNSTPAAPVFDGQFLAAATPEGGILVLNFAATPPQVAAAIPTAVDPGDLVIENGIIYTVASGSLYVIDPDVSTPIASIPVSQPWFCVDGNWVFCVNASGTLVGYGPAATTGKQNPNAPTDFTQARSTANLAGIATPANQTLSGSNITGLAVDSDANLVLVSTNVGGMLLGLTFALGWSWTATIPDGPATDPQSAPGVLNAPIVDERNVFVTSRSGAVASVDGRTGNIIGWFGVPNAVITPPAEDRGAVFFGCGDPSNPDRSPYDGALHSVIFGTTYALRLGFGTTGAAAPGGYATISSSDPDEFINFSDPRKCTVEAWINTTAEGEIVSVCPSTGTDKGIGLRLWLGGGNINFDLYSQLESGWQVLTATAVDTAVLDGKWHHVAACAKLLPDDSQGVCIYIDGVSQDVSPNPIKPVPLSPAPVTVPGLLVYLGADATEVDHTPSNPFEGLIGEVRLWDTSLAASEISSRMHDKLRGDEPDLVADWDFNTLGVNDNGPNGLDGQLAPTPPTASQYAGFWLTDLPFEAPNYPYITTQAAFEKLGQPSQNGQPATPNIYNLTLTLLQANGAPLEGEEVYLWYVRHTDLGEPSSIAIGLPKDAGQQMTGILPTDTGTGEIIGNPKKGIATNAFTANTGPDGKIALWVTTTDLNNGPSLDVYTGFMPTNERYHVNALVNNQTLAPPTPPSLITQSKLLQDYYWSTGSSINSSRGRPTYRITLTCINPDNSPCTNELIEMYATDSLTIEVAGQSYDLTTQNSQSFFTDQEGEVTLLVDATDVQSANLSVWAGFMNPTARYTIDPAEDAHQSMSDPNGIMNGTAVQTSKMTMYRTKAEGGPKSGTLLPAAPPPPPAPPPPGPPPKSTFNTTQATSVANTVQHVASAGQEPAASGSSSSTARGRRSKGWPRGSAKTRFAAASATGTLGYMTQPLLIPRDDVITSVYTMKHIDRRRTVTPESVLTSIRNIQPGNSQFNGFIIDTTSGHPVITYGNNNATTNSAMELLQSYRQKQGIPPQTTCPGQAASVNTRDFSLDDLWDDIKDAADDIYNGVEQLAITITNAINVAVQVAGQILSAVVHSVEEAMDAIGNFFAQLLVDLEDLINYLEMLFDFDAILTAHTQIKSTLLDLGTFASKAVGSNLCSQTIGGVMAFLSGQGPLPAGGTNPATAQSSASSPPNSAVSGSNSVGAKSMYSKMKDNQSGMTVSGVTTPAGTAPGQSLDDAIQGFLTGLSNLVTGLPTMSSSDATNALSGLLAGIEKIISAIPTALDAVMAALVKAFADLLDLLNKEIDIPFISALYQWLTGSELSLLDLLCLVLGVVAHVAYLLVTFPCTTTFAEAMAGTLPGFLTPFTKKGGISFPEPSLSPGNALRRIPPPAAPRSLTIVPTPAGDSEVSVAITSPNPPNAGVSATASTTTTIIGTASSTAGSIASATCISVNGSTTSGPFAGTITDGTFTCSGVTVTPGANTVTVTVTDSANKQNTATINIGVYDYTNPLGWAMADSEGLEIFYICLKTVNIGLQAGADYLFTTALPLVYEPLPSRGWTKVFQGLTGMGCSLTYVLAANPAMVGALLTGLEKVGIDPTFDSGKQVGSIYISDYYELMTIASFVSDFINNALISTSGYSEINGEMPGLGTSLTTALKVVMGYDFDVANVNFYASIVGALASVGMMIVGGIESAAAPEFASGSPSDVTTPAKLMYARDVCYRAASMPNFFYTPRGSMAVDNSTVFFGVISVLRFLANAGGLVCNSVAEFEYVL